MLIFFPAITLSSNFEIPVWVLAPVTTSVVMLATFLTFKEDVETSPVVFIADAVNEPDDIIDDATSGPLTFIDDAATAPLVDIPSELIFPQLRVPDIIPDVADIDCAVNLLEILATLVTI